MTRSRGRADQKPLLVEQRPILNNSKRGDAVYDPFAGSGTTIIAAEQTGRRCLAIEIDPVYVDVSVMRWQAFTGRRAVHAETGALFDGAGNRKNTGKAKAQAKRREAPQ